MKSMKLGSTVLVGGAGPDVDGRVGHEAPPPGNGERQQESARPWSGTSALAMVAG
jgi:hypothetical protein